MDDVAVMLPIGGRILVQVGGEETPRLVCGAANRRRWLLVIWRSTGVWLPYTCFLQINKDVSISQ